jgi:hypothetical protein
MVALGVTVGGVAVSVAQRPGPSSSFLQQFAVFDDFATDRSETRYGGLGWAVRSATGTTPGTTITAMPSNAGHAGIRRVFLSGINTASIMALDDGTTVGGLVANLQQPLGTRWVYSVVFRLLVAGNKSALFRSGLMPPNTLTAQPQEGVYLEYRNAFALCVRATSSSPACVQLVGRTDTDWHTFRMWWDQDGTRIWGNLDDEAPTSVRVGATGALTLAHTFQARGQASVGVDIDSVGFLLQGITRW